MPTRIAIIGNCQAQMLEGMFEASTPDITVDRHIPDFEMTEAMHDDVIQRLGVADLIFAQRVAEDFHLSWLRPGALKTEFGAKVLTWPNIYFDGYFPGVKYIYLNNWGKLQSPLEDYHLKEVMEAHERGLSVTEAVNELTRPDLNGDQDPFATSLAQLRNRELDVDIIISDFIEMNAQRRRCLYTPNHPYNFLLAEMGARLSAAAGLQFDTEKAANYGIRLDRIYIPTLPAVRKRYRLEFDGVVLYHGLQIDRIEDNAVKLGKPKSFFPRDLVEQYYRIYDQALYPSREGKLRDWVGFGDHGAT